MARTLHAYEDSIPVIALPENEPVREYSPGSPERAALESALSHMAGEVAEIPVGFGGQSSASGVLREITMPHCHRHVLARAHLAAAKDIHLAIEHACQATDQWAATPFQERASIFRKAADLLAGPWRSRLNAATMLGQSKTVLQAEIDSAAELIDFWRFNVAYMQRIYAEQPISTGTTYNRMDYRPLEGFVYAITPFNFTAIAGNLPTAPALMGNCVLWKPSDKAMLSAYLTLLLLKEAGLPDGVINIVNGDPAMITEVALADSRMAGVHYTGSTQIFQKLWSGIAHNLHNYRSFPRIVGETGGKNFVLAHQSADVDALITAIVRGGYEYQGQKCSAASRVYVPETLWGTVRDRLIAEIETIRMGDVRDFSNFMGAVIDQGAWSRLASAIERAGVAANTRLLTGGGAYRDQGWFIEPTLYEVSDWGSPLLRDELFGPIVAVVPYPDLSFDDVIDRLDREGAYGLTGSIFARERAAVLRASAGLRHAAGNFYINDKPTGAVVGQQPFGGGRLSGTNDKAGSIWNLARWVSPRAVKENFCPPRSYRYPCLGN